MSNPESIVFVASDGVEHKLPTRFEVCDRCLGSGSHVNPSIDGNGISAEKFHDDPEFAEDYFNGDYDVQCETCKGLRVVPVVDETRCDPAILAAYEKDLEETIRAESEALADRRAEMRAMGEW